MEISLGHGEQCLALVARGLLHPDHILIPLESWLNIQIHDCAAESSHNAMNPCLFII